MTQKNDQIRLFECLLQRLVGENASRPQAQLVTLVDQTPGMAQRGERQAVALDDLPQVRRVQARGHFPTGLVTNDQDGPPGLSQGGFDFSGRLWGEASTAGHHTGRWCLLLGQGREHVYGNLKKDRARAPGPHVPPGHLDVLRYTLGMQYPGCKLGDWRHDAHVFGLHLGAAVEIPSVALAADDKQGRARHLGHESSGHRVGHSRA